MLLLKSRNGNNVIIFKIGPHINKSQRENTKIYGQRIKNEK
jgi:hypothetical protein